MHEKETKLVSVWDPCLEKHLAKESAFESGTALARLLDKPQVRALDQATERHSVHEKEAKLASAMAPCLEKHLARESAL